MGGAGHRPGAESGLIPVVPHTAARDLTYAHRHSARGRRGTKGSAPGGDTGVLGPHGGPCTSRTSANRPAHPAHPTKALRPGAPEGA